MKADQIVEFYDPHPGLMGCTVPIPDSVRIVAEYLSQNPMSLKEAIELLNDSIDDGIFETHEDMIIFTIKSLKKKGLIHSWRVVFFRKKNKRKMKNVHFLRTS